MSDSPAPDSDPRRAWQWRPTFGIKTILLVTLLVAVLSATLSGLLGGGDAKPSGRQMMFFIFLAMAAPMLVMIVLSVWPSIRRLIEHFKGSPK